VGTILELQEWLGVFQETQDLREGRRVKISTILGYIDYGDMTLPEFQRGYVWNRSQVRGLFSSLYRGYPVGSLLIWTTEVPPSLRRDDSEIPGVVRLLLDGQQRITSIYGVMRGKPPAFFQGNERAFRDLYFDLRSETFEFYGPVKMRGDRLWINVTELYQRGIEEMMSTIASPEDSFATTLEYSTRLGRIYDIQQRVMHIEEIMGSERTIDEVVDIFNRVNSGGTKLSKADLALARIAADRPAARNELRTVLAKWERAGYSFKIDWLLRGVTAVVTKQARFSGLVDVESEAFAHGIRRTERALDFMLNLISDRLGLDHDRVLGGRYALPVIAPFVDEHGGSISDDALQRKILYWYVNSFMWGRYSGSTETKMQRDLEALEQSGVDGLIEELRLARTSLEVRPEDLDAWSTGARLYPVLYMMTRVGGARDLVSGLSLAAGMLGQQSSLQVHHVFPKKLLYEAGYKRPQVNALANFSFLTAVSNQSIGARRPREYLAEVAARHPGVLASQWIPEDPALWEIDRYLDFLQARRELMARAVNDFLARLLEEDEALPEVVPGAQSVAPSYEDEESADVSRILGLVKALGLQQPEVDFEVVDRETGEILALADVVWPLGVQEGLTEPVAFLAEADAEAESRLGELGYRFFTSLERLVWYLEELVGVDIDGDGELGEPDAATGPTFAEKGHLGRGDSASDVDGLAGGECRGSSDVSSDELGGRSGEADSTPDSETCREGARAPEQNSDLCKHGFSPSECHTCRHSTPVYVTGGGQAYHLERDCSALQRGQDEVLARGGTPEPIETRTLSRALADGRHLCRACASRADEGI